MYEIGMTRFILKKYEGGYSMKEAIDTWRGADQPMDQASRVKVHIRCQKCGESFILRGTRDHKGRIDTGFKRCLCDNDRFFEIQPLV